MRKSAHVRRAENRLENSRASKSACVTGLPSARRRRFLLWKARKLRSFFENQKISASRRMFRAGDCGEKSRRAAADDYDAFRIHSRDNSKSAVSKEIFHSPNIAAWPQGLPSYAIKFQTVAREMRKRFSSFRNADAGIIVNKSAPHDGFQQFCALLAVRHLGGEP